MKRLQISEAKNAKNKQFRAFIAYFLLIIASLLILLAGHQIIYLFGFELDTRIRDVDAIKAVFVFITMLPIVFLIIYFTLKFINKLYIVLKI